MAPVPLWATLVLGALPIAEFGSPTLKDAVLPGVVSGDQLLTAALAGVADDIARGGPGRPAVAGKSGADGLVLTGTAFAVPSAHVADRVLVPVSLGDADDGLVIAVIDPKAAGVTVERAVTTNREIHPHLHLDGVVVPADDLLADGDPTRGHEVLFWILNRAWTGTVRPPGGGDRGGGGPDGRVPQHPRAVRPAAVAPSRGPCCGRPTPPSTPRPSGSRCGRPPGGWTTGSTPTWP